jgi:hypothetical protein
MKRLGDQPIACRLSDAALHEREATLLLARFRSVVMATEELLDGYAFRMPGDEKWMLLVFELMVAERGCCPFLRFELVANPDMGPVDLRVTGPAGAKSFVEAIFYNRENPA